MREYNHIGIPTSKKHENEFFIEEAGLYATDYNDDPFKIEWLRFLPGCGGPDILQKSPHIAFFVDDLQEEIKSKEILIEPHDDGNGNTMCFILHEGFPVELIQKKE